MTKKEMKELLKEFLEDAYRTGYCRDYWEIKKCAENMFMGALIVEAGLKVADYHEALDDLSEQYK